MFGVTCMHRCQRPRQASPAQDADQAVPQGRESTGFPLGRPMLRSQWDTGNLSKSPCCGQEQAFSTSRPAAANSKQQAAPGRRFPPRQSRRPGNTRSPDTSRSALPALYSPCGCKDQPEQRARNPSAPATAPLHGLAAHTPSAPLTPEALLPPLHPVPTATDTLGQSWVWSRGLRHQGEHCVTSGVWLDLCTKDSVCTVEYHEDKRTRSWDSLPRGQSWGSHAGWGCRRERERDTEWPPAGGPQRNTVRKNKCPKGTDTENWSVVGHLGGGMSRTGCRPSG